MLRRAVGVLCVASARGASWSFESNSLSPFELSSDAKYAGQSVSVRQGALYLEEANQHYGVAAPTSVKADEGELAVQYELTLTDGLTCGGAYIKLLEGTATLSATNFDDKTPFVIMFGPDKCGATDKVHFILRFQNPVTGESAEHHLSTAVRVETDRKSHLYTAIVRSDDSLELLVDGESKFKGSLLDDLDPPLQPPAEVDDPDDVKPEDWVDEALMDDSAASKPEDWDEDAPRKIDDPDAAKPAGWEDSEPSVIPDPEASMPADWDEEEDGEWEAPEVANPKCGVGCGEWKPPLVENPSYRGKWIRPKVDNPAYKGVWAPRKIPNPKFFTLDKPAKSLPEIGALAIEIWTTNKGITFNNFVLSSKVEDLDPYATAFHEAKAAEKAAEDAKKAAKKAEKLLKKSKLKGLKGLSGRIQTHLQPIIAKLDPLAQVAHENPAAAAGTGFVLLITLVFLLLGGKKKKQQQPEAAPAAAPEPETDAKEDDEDDDNKEKKTPRAD